MTHPFQKLGLSASLADVVTKLGFNQPTEVQLQSIPHIVDGKNILAGAQTGTGKTAAFGLPIIQRFLDAPVTREMNSCVVRALVLVPTRELAQQVFDNITAYSEQTNLKVVTAYGGTSMNVQTQNLKGGADILVATPGRLIDHLFCKNIILSQTEVLVLDEADRMLDMGFMPDIQRILKRMNEERQTLFFSATFDQKIKMIAHKMMSNPVEVQVAPSNSTAESVKQMVYPVDKKRKSELLAYLIGSKNWQQVLVFVKTKQGTDALVKELKLDGIKAASIHGDKSQGARQKSLDDFKSGKVRALIATDVAARGLDIHQLEQVVNYDLPYKAEDYVHRIGRTGRAGATGLAVSLMSRDEEYLLKAIEDLLDKPLPQEWLQGFEPSLKNVEDLPDTSRRRGRSSEKQKMKAKLKIHSGRGKKR
ncbi:DEAD/DEAH box helicase [Vibrio sp. ZSDE26]|uniref:DEAD/DEAH box helicase n=1 Tax=Vibrio amylolyticus TaxID=2847292 RepID=A0A9X2BHC2_9VIBR|nr:DEAD/DEAH box helicase [Vibrio amylolyticus]MCK6263644.1 DEAD/DEAH box helicase [Vibrio amylolyticus]